MAMTKKDYEAFAALNNQMVEKVRGMAKAFSNNLIGYDIALYESLVGQIRIFTKDNQRFDPVRFLEASGIQQPYIDKIIKDASNV